MKAKILSTEREYEAALAHVERLMDMANPDEVELDNWSALVAKYEDTHFPIAAPNAVEATRFRLEQAG